MKFDHIAIACTDLDQGVACVETQLGVPMEKGGRHAYFGTHNALLGLGKDAYLEVIAIDPDSSYDGPRWFDLNNFSGAPRPVAWICSVEDMDDALAGCPLACKAHDLQRGALTWRFACPDTGELLMGGAFPYLIEWGKDAPHPTRGLPDRGLRLKRVDITHPEAVDISADLPCDLPVRFHRGAETRLSVVVENAAGLTISL